MKGADVISGAGRRARYQALWLPIGALLLVVTSTRALATDTCVVGRSPDGYVALRSSANAQGSLLTRARPGQAVVIEKRADGNAIESGSWLRVFHFPGRVVPPKTDPAYARGRSGWMHRRYVVDCG